MPILVWVSIYQSVVFIDRKHGTISIPNSDDTELALWRHPELTSGYAIRRIIDDKDRFGLRVEHYRKSKIIDDRTSIFLS